MNKFELQNNYINKSENILKEIIVKTPGAPSLKAQAYKTMDSLGMKVGILFADFETLRIFVMIVDRRL